MQQATRHGAAEWLMAACGAWLVGLGLFLAFVRPSLLPEDLRYMGVDGAALQVVAPGLLRWLAKVFTVMGGFMTGTGVLVVYTAWRVMPLRARRMALVLGVSGALTLGVTSAVNFGLHSDFRGLLAVPPPLCGVATAAYARTHRGESPDPGSQ